jgi:hypothetical protein
MKNKIIVIIGFALATAIAESSAHATLPTSPTPDLSRPIYAQAIVDQIVATHPAITDVIFHVTPPGQTQNLAIASHSASERGKLSGDDDLGVIRTGEPLVEVQKDGVHIGVLVPLRDRRESTIGALGIVYTYHRGESEQAFVLKSIGIRNVIARRIPSIHSLFVHDASVEIGR